jgi:hypothetical protein
MIIVKSWSTANLPISDISKTSFTIAEIASVAEQVKGYVDTYYTLPTFITISGVMINQAQYLQLLTEATTQLNSTSTTSTTVIKLQNIYLPSTTNSDSLTSGTLNKTTYVALAQSILTLMGSTGKGPSTMTVSLGNISFQSLVYMYSRVLTQYKTHQTLPTTIIAKSWSTTNIPIYDDSFTISQIAGAAAAVKGYVEAYHSLPEYITINNVLVNQAQYLYLLVTASVKINSSNTSTPIYLVKATLPSSISDSITSGSMSMSELLTLGNTIQSYILNNKQSLGSISTSLGTAGFQTLIYTYSKALNYYNSNGALPSTVTDIKPWSLVVYNLPAGYEVYLAASANCQSNDASIIALANSITSGSSSPYDSAVRIFNWVRDNLGYSFYYNTKYGAVGTLSAGSGNCVDTSHLLIALYRASGLAARYVHGYCCFSSGNWYGHVWAEVYVNGGWVTTDATSSANTFGVINNWNTGTNTVYGTYASLPF